MDAWKDYPDTFELSFKYAIAHMYSIPNPPFIQPALPHITKEHRTWLTVRDDDIYSFRWGNPEFAREFINNMPGPDKMAGFYMGPDGTVWGREFSAKIRENAARTGHQQALVFVHAVGPPELRSRFAGLAFRAHHCHRFPQVPAARCCSAWAEASKVFPQITRFFWGDIDVRWFPEACLSHPKARRASTP